MLVDIQEIFERAQNSQQDSIPKHNMIHANGPASSNPPKHIFMKLLGINTEMAIDVKKIKLKDQRAKQMAKLNISL